MSECVYVSSRSENKNNVQEEEEVWLGSCTVAVKCIQLTTPQNGGIFYISGTFIYLYKR